MIFGKRIIVVAALAALVSASFAQGFRGFGPQTGVGLLRRPDVQTDLKLSDDQKTKITDLLQKMRDKGREVFQNANGDFAKAQTDMKAVNEESTKEANTILTADQQTRLKQIGIQLAGNGAAAIPEVQTDLKLTDDQKTKIALLQKTAMDANQSVGAKMRSQEVDRDAGMASIKKNNDTLNDEIGKVLTDDQKADLKKLGGPAFTADPPPGG